MASIEQAASMLGGMGAGLMGQGPQFLQVQNQTRQLENQEQQQRQINAQERMKTFYTDAAAMLNLAEKGKFDGVQRLGMERLFHLKSLAQQDPTIDPKDTQIITSLAAAAQKGNRQSAEQLKAFLGSVVDVAKATGIIQQPQSEIIPQSAVSPTGQVAMRNPDGTMGMQNLPGFSAPAQEGFEIITPEVAAQLGLPTDKQFQRNKQTQQISQIGSGPAVQVNTGTATEGERTAGILANRLDFAQSQINDILAEAPQAESPEMVPTVLGSLGFDYLSRVSNPAERQVIEAAQDDMLDAALTLGTGAAYTETQFKAYKRSYFPQLGDDQKTIEAKARRLTNLLDAAYAKAGRGAPEVRRSEMPVINSTISTTPQMNNDDPLGLFTPSAP